MHSAAKEYAEAGIRIFPCKPGSKDPACAHGFWDSTVDLSQIDQWWTENPDYNIAFSPHDCGWGIVDIDSPEAREAWNARASDDDPPTWEVRTPRGGAHIYYLGELPTSVGSRVIPGQKIDTRGKGSYALLPPSRTSAGIYETVCDADVAPLPEWVAQAIKDTARGGGIEGAEDIDLNLPANIARAKHFLANNPPAIEGQFGNKHTYVTACTLHNLGVSEDLAFDLMEPWNDTCEPPWDYDELKQVIANGYAYPQNSPGSHAAANTSGAFGEYARSLRLEEGRESIRRSKFYPEDETEQEEGKEPTWLLQDLIPDGATVMLYGPTQSYKSFIGLDLALSIAAGIDSFAGAPTRSGPVFYAALEGRQDLKKKRRRAWKLARQIDAVPGFYVMPAPLLILEEEEQEFIDQIRKRLDGRHCAAIFLDTLAKMMAGLNENDARDMGRFIRLQDKLAEEFDCPVIAVHHTGRDESHERGSSSAKAGVSTVIRVTAHRDTRMVSIVVEKQKDAEERSEPWFMEGKVVAGSLAFQPVTRAEYDAATKAESLYTHRKIGVALKALGACGEGHAVFTHVLASELVAVVEGEDPEARQKKLTSAARALVKLAKDSLLGYVTKQGSDLTWSLPVG